MGAPPDTHTRRCSETEVTGVLREATYSSSAQYIVGTPIQKPTFSAAMVSRTAAGSNRGNITNRTPPYRHAFIWHVWAVEWKSGSVTSSTSWMSAPRIAGDSMWYVTMAFESM